MSRNVALNTLVEDVRLEIGHSIAANLGQNYKPVIVRKLQKVQERLHKSVMWPFLKVVKDKSIVAGSRYYDFPTGISPEGAKFVDVYYSGSWIPVDPGIDMNDYNAQDSDNDIRNDPVQRWDYHYVDTSNTVQFEVWPLPASASTLRFTGNGNLQTFVADSDRCTLDSELLILFAAGEILQRQGNEEAGNILKQAENMKNALKGRSSKRKLYSFSSGMPNMRQEVRRPPLVAVVET